MKNKKNLLYIISSSSLVLVLTIGAIIATSCSNDNMNGTIVHPTNLDNLPSSVDALVVEKQSPQVEGKKAAIKTSEEYTEYDTIKEAYEEVNTNYRHEEATLIFYDNWIAEGENGFGDYGSGWNNGGYGKGGTITPFERSDALIIDLNGYILGRKLDTAIFDGGVINISYAGNLTIKNGYITGGNTTGNGGGITINYVGGDSIITFDNLHIRNNYCDGKGGGIYSSYQDASIYVKDTDVYINNCSIFYNVAKNMGGGMLLDMQDQMSDYPKISLQNKVVVCDNTASDSSKHNNLTFVRTEHCIARLKSIDDLLDTSNIYVSFSDNTSDDESISSYSENKEHTINVKNCFHCDDSGRQIIIYDSGSKNAIEIAKKSGC